MAGAPPRVDALPRAAAGEAPPRGHAGRFPRPRARYLALRASAASEPLGVVKRWGLWGRGAGRAVQPGGREEEEEEERKKKEKKKEKGGGAPLCCMGVSSRG